MLKEETLINNLIDKRDRLVHSRELLKKILGGALSMPAAFDVSSYGRVWLSEEHAEAIVTQMNQFLDDEIHDTNVKLQAACNNLASILE